MKKYLLIVLVSCLLLMNAAIAKTDTIVPQQLTAQDTGNYIIMNNTSEKVFSNVIPRIKINTNHIYSTFDKNLIVLKNDKYKNPNYNYVKYKYAELVYAKHSKDLLEIRVEKLHNPRSYAVYDYPTGRLKYFQIYDEALRDFTKFTPYGSLYNPRIYLTNLSMRVTRRLNVVVSDTLPSPVKIYIDVDKDGELLDARIEQSSGDETIDKEILETVKISAPFDKFPRNFPSHLEMILEFGAKK